MNPKKEKIINNARIHPESIIFNSEIDLKTLRVIQREEGYFRVSNKMTYKSKPKITDHYTFYKLRLITEWDDNFKLKSIREIRL